MVCRLEISSEVFREAWENKDNRNVIKHVCGKYRDSLDPDLLKQCGLQALWRALQCYDPSYGQKFTTSLYRFVGWECGRELGRQAAERKKHGHCRGLYDDDEPTYLQTADDDLEHLLHHLNSLTPRQRRLVQEYYLGGLSLKKIGKRLGCTAEAARHAVQRAVAVLRQKCLEPLGVLL